MSGPSATSELRGTGSSAEERAQPLRGIGRSREAAISGRLPDWCAAGMPPPIAANKMSSLRRPTLWHRLPRRCTGRIGRRGTRPEVAPAERSGDFDCEPGSSTRSCRTFGQRVATATARSRVVGVKTMPTARVARRYCELGVYVPTFHVDGTARSCNQQHRFEMSIELRI